MLFRLPEPPFGERNGHWDSNQHADARQRKENIDQLPHEISPPGPSRGSSSSGCDILLAMMLSNRTKRITLPTYIRMIPTAIAAIMRPRAERPERPAGQDQFPRTRQPGCAQSCLGWPRKAGAVATVRAKFSGQQPDKSELRPLRNPKGPEQLLLGVFYGERDRVRGGNRQRAPRGRMPSAARY